MARIEGAEHPIRYEPVSGKAVDKWNAMREENNNERFTAEKFRKSYEANKEKVYGGLDKLIEAVGGEAQTEK